MRIDFNSFSSGNFGGIDMTPELYKVEITIGETKQTQQLHTIPLLAFQEFQNYMTQLAQDKRPCKVKFSKKEQVWLELSKQFKELENSVEFKNLVYGDKD